MSTEAPVIGETHLTAAQAAAQLGVTKGWILRLIQSGRLPAEKRVSPIGDYWLVAAVDLEAVRGLKRTGRPAKNDKKEQNDKKEPPAS